MTTIAKMASPPLRQHLLVHYQIITSPTSSGIQTLVMEIYCSLSSSETIQTSLLLTQRLVFTGQAKNIKAI